MSFTAICTSRIAGFKIANADIDDNAAIALSKLGTRTKKIKLSFDYFDGTTAFDGVFPEYLFAHAAQKTGYVSFPFPTDYASGDVIVNVYWKTAGSTGNVKITADIKSTPTTGSTASEDTQNDTDASATTITKSTFTFAAALFAAGDIVGLAITRDSSDAADTNTDDVEMVAVELEYTARG